MRLTDIVPGTPVTVCRPGYHDRPAVIMELDPATTRVHVRFTDTAGVSLNPLNRAGFYAATLHPRYLYPLEPTVP